MEGRRWEELDANCLHEVLERVGMECLLLDIPFVCKSWYKASLDPQCWKHLDFTILNNKNQQSFTQKFIQRFGHGTTGHDSTFSDSKFMTFLAHPSGIYATSLVLPNQPWTFEFLEYFSNECPKLRILSARVCFTSLSQQNDYLGQLIGKFKDLECLHLDRSSDPIDGLLLKISLNCNHFTAFFTNGEITDNVGNAIVSHIPKIQCLSLRGATKLLRHALVHILQGCNDLKIFDISNSVGCEVDEEILQLASHILLFSYQGCRK